MSVVSVTKATGSTVLYNGSCYLEEVNITRAGDATTALDLYDANVATFPTAPTAPTGAVVAGTALGVGAYLYKVTYVSTLGETTGGTESAAITTTSNNQAINLTIPTGPAGTIARKIYRTLVAGATGTEKFVATVNDNTTTLYADTTPDASISGNAAVPGSNTITASNIFTAAGAITGAFPQSSNPDGGIRCAWGISQILTASTSPYVEVVARNR